MDIFFLFFVEALSAFVSEDDAEKSNVDALLKKITSTFVTPHISINIPLAYHWYQ